jgi:glycine/D-amino acid oxidase-like deaminating enzyme
VISHSLVTFPSLSLSLEMSTVIIGTGIIGASTAYYLSQNNDPSSIHLIESSPTLFASASGYAGGFIAKDWFSAPSASLGELSYAEHRRLADEYGGREKWGYNICKTSSYTPGGFNAPDGVRGEDWLMQGTSRVGAARKVVDGAINHSDHEPKWLNKGNGLLELIEENGGTAGV